jgi:energy-coupling factor transporter ATP-binding protein EcfA2
MAHRTLHIKEFDMNSIDPNSKIVVIGRPGSGKTRCLISLLQALAPRAPVGVVMSGTEDSNNTYAAHFPEAFIYNELDIDAMAAFIKRQKFAQRYNLPEKHAVLLLDDCTDDVKQLNHKIFHNIFKNGRHYDMTFILSLQYAMDVKPYVRTNTDYIFIMAARDPQTKRKLFDNYVDVFDSLQDFSDVIDQVTQDYTALVVDNRPKGTGHVEETIYYWRANLEIQKGFRFGCGEMWDWNEERLEMSRELH